MKSLIFFDSEKEKKFSYDLTIHLMNTKNNVKIKIHAKTSPTYPYLQLPQQLLDPIFIHILNLNNIPNKIILRHKLTPHPLNNPI